jgi:hypothetical protein
LASSPFTASPKDDVAAFVIDETALSACTRIHWGGSELWRPRSQTRHLLMAYFGLPFVRQMYDWGNGLEGGEGRGPFVSRGFHRVGHGSGGCFLRWEVVFA